SVGRKVVSKRSPTAEEAGSWPGETSASHGELTIGAEGWRGQRVGHLARRLEAFLGPLGEQASTIWTNHSGRSGFVQIVDQEPGIDLHRSRRWARLRGTQEPAAHKEQTYLPQRDPEEHARHDPRPP